MTKYYREAVGETDSSASGGSAIQQPPLPAQPAQSQGHSKKRTRSAVKAAPLKAEVGQASPLMPAGVPSERSLLLIGVALVGVGALAWLFHRPAEHA